jgi:hypothetical protein
LYAGVNINQAIFMSVNTRHAGFTAVNLDEQNAGILILFLAMMFLAPTPFVVVLKRSAQEQDTQRLERSMSIAPDEALDFRPSSLMFPPMGTDDVGVVGSNLDASSNPINDTNDRVAASNQAEVIGREVEPFNVVQRIDPEPLTSSSPTSPASRKLQSNSHRRVVSVDKDDEGDEDTEDVELEDPTAGYSNRRMASRVLSMGLVVRKKK